MTKKEKNIKNLIQEGKKEKSIEDLMQEGINKYETIQRAKEYLYKTRNLVLLEVLIFLFFLVMSFVLYPLSYSVKTNWISNLGMYFLNPAGAIWFNVGLMGTGIFLIGIFFKGKNNYIKFFGIIMSFCMFMVGYFPQDSMINHSLFADIYFKCALICIILITLVVKDRAMQFYGLITIGVNIYFLTLGFGPFWEWIAFTFNFVFINYSAYKSYGINKE